MVKDFLEIVKESKTYREEEYIEYFFEQIVSMKDKKPIFTKLDGQYPNTFMSIVKDSTERILENSKGKLMERSWRNTIFCFIDKNTYINYFGTNDLYPNFYIDGTSINFTNQKTSVNSKYPNLPRLNREVSTGFKYSLFNHFKKNKSSWFVRSYVYFVLIYCDKDSEITDKDFSIHYWNTNYKFSPIVSKSSIFHNVKDSYFVTDIENEIKLIEMSNRDAIDCVLSFTGTLDYKNQTDENYLDIKNDIESGVNYVIVKGAARTGKTILAMRLLSEFPTSNLLLMNYYFYVALKDSFKIQDIPFPSERIYHHDLSKNDGCWVINKKTKKIKPSLEFLIVDEAQRLAFMPEYINHYQGYVLAELDQLDRILFDEKQKHTILLGDDYQKLNPSYDEGLEKARNLLLEKNKNFREYNFKKSIGISPEILDNIKSILDIENKKELKPTHNFSICVTSESNKFFEEFNSDKSIKKHFISIGLKELEGQKLITDSFELIEYPTILKQQDFPYLFNTEVVDKYLFSTYEVISREIESVYLFIPEQIGYNKLSQKIEFIDPKNSKSNEFLINHLYTLMTRATMNLYLLCENLSLYEYFKEKFNYIDELNQNAMVDNVEEDLEIEVIKYDYDIFIAYHGTNNPTGSYTKAKELCDILTSKGYSVFLNDYSCNTRDKGIGFNETTYVIQRSENFLLVLNDSIYLDEFGMIPRIYIDNKVNQLYSELKMFESLVQDNQRKYKENFKFYYDGSIFSKHNIYNHLNQVYREGTLGNSNACLFTSEELILFMEKKNQL